MDYSSHLLRTTGEIEAFKAKYRKVLPAAMDNTKVFLGQLPNNAWVRYLKGVPEKNIPLVIGCICLYIQDYDFVTECIDFNDTATMLRYKRHEWKNMNNIEDYAKHREKMQNNGGSEQ